jgi:hypothetical protein
MVVGQTQVHFLAASRGQRSWSAIGAECFERETIYVCMYLCMYVCMAQNVLIVRPYMYVCMYVYVGLYVCMAQNVLSVRPYMYVCMYVCW